MGLADLFLGFSGMGGGATPPIAAPPQQPRSRLEELLLQLNGMQDQPLPTWQTMPGEDRRRARGQGMLALAAAFGNADQGHIGTALAQGAFDAGAIQDAAVRRAREDARQQSQEQRLNLGRQIEVERALREERRLTDTEERDTRKRRELGELAESLRGTLDPNDPRIVEAQTLAEVGDHAGLAKLAGEIRGEKKKHDDRVVLAEKYHLDPEDPFFDKVVEQLELKARHLGAYHEQPREGQLVQDETGRYVLVDQVSGRVTPTPVQGRLPGGGKLSPEEKHQEADLQKATAFANQEMVRAAAQYQRDLAAWMKAEGYDAVGNEMPRPVPPQVDFEATTVKKFQEIQRARAAAKPAPLVNPLEGHADGAPTSATGPGKGSPQKAKYGPDDVYALLPKNVLLAPEARALFEKELAAGKTPQQIVADVLASAQRQSQKALPVSPFTGQYR